MTSDLFASFKYWTHLVFGSPLYSNHLNSGQVWYSNGPNLSGCKMVWFSNCGLKTRQKMYVLWSKMLGIQMVCLITRSNHLKTGQKSVGEVKCLDFRCSVFRWLLSLFSNYHELSLSRDIVRGCFCGCPRRGRSRWALGRTSDPRWRIRLSRLVTSRHRCCPGTHSTKHVQLVNLDLDDMF